jgi:hypothetical protein
MDYRDTSCTPFSKSRIAQSDGTEGQRLAGETQLQLRRSSVRELTRDPVRPQPVPEDPTHKGARCLHQIGPNGRCQVCRLLRCAGGIPSVAVASGDAAGSVAVRVRLVGSGDVDTEVLGLGLGQLGEPHA